MMTSDRFPPFFGVRALGLDKPFLEFLARVGWGIAAAGILMAGAAQGHRMRPNVILIVADDLGWGDVGCYGQTQFDTPKLDALAAQGMRFTQYYAGSSVGAASRCAFMTGYHTGHARIRGSGTVPLAADDVTIGEVAKQAGYATFGTGIWGLGGPGSSGLPTVQGFDNWFGLLKSAKVYEHFPASLWYNQTNLFLAQNTRGQKTLYAPYLFTQAATNFIALNRGRPFLLYLPYTLPHARLEAPTNKPYRQRNWPETQKTLAAMIFRLDRDVGRILDTLKVHHLERNTIVFFTSDNGPDRSEGVDPAFFNSGGPFQGIKGDLHEGGIRVPMIVRWLGKIRPGAVSDHVWAAWDLLPTLAELMGPRPPKGIDGTSILPVLLGKKQRERKYLYWEEHGRGFSQAVRMGRWKGLRRAMGNPIELYDLEVDPGETHDVSREHRRIVRRIERYARQAHRPSPDWPVAGLDSN